MRSGPAAPTGRRVAVLGAGVAGLTAARDLAERGHRVLVLEATDRVGGKLRAAHVAGVRVDVGAEAMLARRREGLDLAERLGLRVVHPTPATSRIWTRGALRPLPRTLMGAPLDLDALASSGILSADGVRRARRPGAPDAPVTALLEDDVSVGDLVAARFGDEVVDRLVEPMLGGVYAGRARAISARAAAPQLLALERTGWARVPPGTPGPVFAGLQGGMSVLTDRLAEGLEVRTGTTVRGLARAVGGFEVLSGPTTDPRREVVDAVVVAVPAAPGARLLRPLAPAAADALQEVEAASVAVVTLAFRRAGLPEGLMAASGFLVPPVDGRSIKAATFSAAKWEWVGEAGRQADDVVLLRTSLGRVGEERTLQREDHELVADSLCDLRAAAGIDAVPVQTHVQRWGAGLPQYAVGHLDRVERVRAAVAAVPGLAVCGATYDGVGIAACIASAHRAADEVARHLAGRGDGGAHVPGRMEP